MVSRGIRGAEAKELDWQTMWCYVVDKSIGLP